MIDKLSYWWNPQRRQGCEPEASERKPSGDIDLGQWVHPKIRGRMALDYPLDCLLNRACRLSDYERGALTDLRRYNSCVYALASFCREGRRVDRFDDVERMTAALAAANAAAYPSSRSEVIGKAQESDLDSIKRKHLDNALDGAATDAPLMQAVWKDLARCWVRLGQYGGQIGALQLDPNDPVRQESDLRPKGSGNILVLGRPGTGKSTLAMQMALAATTRPNHYAAFLVTVEEDREHVLRKAHSLGLTDSFRVLEHLGALDGSTDSSRLASELRFALTKPAGCPLRGGAADGKHDHTHGSEHGRVPAVFLPRLSPRSIRVDGAAGASLFWERFGQLERLLLAAKELRRQSDLPEFRMVCIDGLNAFGERTPTRDEMAKLFDLFQRTGFIGVVTAEQESGAGADAASDAMQYLADIVINLSMKDDRGYAVRYLEVAKSRYHHEVYGKHFVRLRGSEIYSQHRTSWSSAGRQSLDAVQQSLEGWSGMSPRDPCVERDAAIVGPSGTEILFDQGAICDAKERILEELYWRRFCGILKEGKPSEIIRDLPRLLDQRSLFQQTLMVQPSVHYVVGATERKEGPSAGGVPGSAVNKESPSGGVRGFKLGEKNLDTIIKFELPRGRVVTIKGPPGSYKSIIAKNFILHGLRGEETVLYIGLGETTTFDPNQAARCLVSREVAKGRDSSGFDFGEFKLVLCRGLDDAKRRMHVFESPDRPGRVKYRLYDLAVKGGALLAEEMLEFVRDILRQEVSRPIEGEEKPLLRRVVLDDVALIGASYPFLRESSTAGDLFLPAFVHVMRNYGVDLLLVGTTGQLVEGDRMVDRACLLADTVVTTSHTNVFGDRYVTVTGEGLAHAFMHESDDDQIGTFEYSPGVIRADPEGRQTGGPGCFEVNLELLKGLVGFGTDKVSRPKLILQMSDQPGEIYKKYRRDVDALIRDAMAPQAASTAIQGTPDDRAPPEIADPVHFPLEVLEDKPLEHTVVYVLDEFWRSPHLKPTRSLAKLTRYFTRDREPVPADESTSDSTAEPKWGEKEFMISPYFSGRAAKDGKTGSDGSSNAERRDSGEPYAVPFYGNVLLVAFHKDARVLQPGATRTTWKALDEAGREYGFDCDTMAKETLACLLLDALLAAEPEGLAGAQWARRCDPAYELRESDDEVGRHLLEDMLCKLDQNSQLLAEFVENMKHVATLLDKADGYSKRSDRRSYILNAEAKVFVCWYSQLRELINSPNGEKLASKLRICAMPGGGFRGDWYLAVAKGSVSLDLGVRAVEILTRIPQEYDRFARGVGLPVRNVFREKEEERNFFAWPHSAPIGGNKAADLFKIHRAANSRASIPKYTQFRRNLAIMVDEVLLAYREHRDDSKGLGDAVREILVRLPHQIGMLVGT